MVAGLVQVCETNAKILEESWMGPSLRTVGSLLLLLGHADFTGNLLFKLSTKKKSPAIQENKTVNVFRLLKRSKLQI